MESSDKDQIKKKITKVKTFPVPFALEEIKENISIPTNSQSKHSKEQIINQTFKIHSQGNTIEAAKNYQQLINQGCKDHRVFSNYGIILKNLGKLKEAELLQRKAIELKPDFFQAYLNLGNILKNIGNLKQAEISYRKAIELKPDFAEAHLNLGNIFNELGNLRKAELFTRKAIELNPNFSMAHSNLGSILKDIGKLQEAELSTRKAIELNPDFPIAYVNLGIILNALGKLEEAEVFTLKAIALNPSFAEAHSNLGIILNGLGKLQEAEVSTRKAIELKPDFAEAHLHLGGILKGLEELQEAEVSTRKAIELKPDFAEAHSNLGNILKDLGQSQEAELLQRKAIKLNPDYSEAYSDLGIILRDRGNLEEAISLQSKAIELKPDFFQAHRELAICLYLLEDIDSALNSIVKANSLEPENKTNQLLLSIFQKEQNFKNRDLEISNYKSNFTKKRLETNPLMLNIPVEVELIDSLYKIKARDQEKYQGPTYGDAIGSDYKLFERSDSSINRIKEKLTTISRDFVKSDIFISDSFFTIFRSGGGLGSHNHLSKLDKIKGLNIAEKKFSLVYYLSVGDQKCDHPGVLKLESPNQDILPNNGLVIIFPAERKHSVFYKGQKDRIIIGVNFYRV